MRLNFICGRLIKTFHKGFIIFLLSIVAYNLQASRYIAEYPASVQDSRPGNIILAGNGLSAYRIVLPSFATIHEQKAAEVLQDYLLQISFLSIILVKEPIALLLFSMVKMLMVLGQFAQQGL